MNSVKTTAELLPCPFCGCKEIYMAAYNDKPNKGYDSWSGRVVCNGTKHRDCGYAHIEGVKNHSTKGALVKELTELWNTRYDAHRLAELEAENKRLLKAMAEAKQHMWNGTNALCEAEQALQHKVEK